MSANPDRESPPDIVARLRARLGFPFRVAEWMTCRREVLDIFVYRPGRVLRKDPAFLTFDAGRMPSPEVQHQLRALHGNPLEFLVAMNRLRTGQGVLTCAVENGRLVGFGWFLRWDHFRRKFAWLAPEGRMAAFHWVDPAARGNGLMGRLMEHGMATIDGIGTLPLVAHTSPDNKASQRGLDKMGFVRLGRYEVVQWLAGAFFQVREIEHACDLASAMRAQPDATPR